LDRLIGLLLLCLLFVAPLLFSASVYESFLLPKACFIFLIIALILPLFTVRLFRRGMEFSFPADIYLLGLPLAVVISWWGSQDKPLFFFNFAFLLIGYLTYFIVENLVSNPRRTKLFLGALLVSATILALIGLIQYLAYRGIIRHFPYFPVPYRPPELRTYGNRVYSTYGQPNNLGLYLSLGLLVGLYFWLESNPPASWRRWSMAAGMLPLFALLFFVVDASGGLGLYCGLAGVGVYLGLGRVYLGREWFSARKVKIGLFVLVMLLTLCFSQVILSETSSWRRTTHSIQHVVGKTSSYGSITNRLVYWRNSLEIFRRSPLWGVGLGQFGANYLPSLAGLISRTDSEFLKRNAYPAIYAHNEFLQFLAETGILGLACFSLIWFMVFKNTLKTLSDSPSSLLLLTGSLFVPFLIQSLLSAPFRRLSLIVIFAFMLGIWVRQIPSYRRKSYSVSPGLGRLVVPLVLLLSLILIWGVYDNWQAGKKMYNVLKLRDKGQFLPPELIGQIGANPYLKLDLTAIVAHNALKLGVTSRRREWVELAYHLYKQMLAKLPTHKYCRLMAASCFYLGKEQEGVEYLKQGLKYVPRDKPSLRMLIDYYQRRGPEDQARYWLRELEKYYPRTPKHSPASVTEKGIG
jgi:hypothetical protein